MREYSEGGVENITRNTHWQQGWGGLNRANKLHLFFNRFDTRDPVHPPYIPPLHPPVFWLNTHFSLGDPSPPTSLTEYFNFTVFFTADQIRRQLRRFYAEVSSPSLMMPHPRSSCDYRPVALMSHIMNTLERLILEQLWPMVSPRLDPLWFAYQPRLEVEDTIIYLLEQVCARTP